MKEKREFTILVAFTAVLMLGVIVWNAFAAPVPSDLVISYSSDGQTSQTSPSSGSQEKPPSSSLEPSDSGGSLSEDKVNINTAGVEELCRLPGIGEVLAGRIIGYRQEYGPYTDPVQLKNIKGIGDKVYEKLLPMVTW